GFQPAGALRRAHRADELVVGELLLRPESEEQYGARRPERVAGRRDDVPRSKTSGVQREVSGNDAPWIRRRSVAEGDHHVAIARMNGKDNSLRTPAARPSRERR